MLIHGGEFVRALGGDYMLAMHIFFTLPPCPQLSTHCAPDGATCDGIVRPTNSRSPRPSRCPPGCPSSPRGCYSLVRSSSAGGYELVRSCEHFIHTCSGAARHARSVSYSGKGDRGPQATAAAGTGQRMARTTCAAAAALVSSGPGTRSRIPSLLFMSRSCFGSSTRCTPHRASSFSSGPPATLCSVWRMGGSRRCQTLRQDGHMTDVKCVCPILILTGPEHPRPIPGHPEPSRQPRAPSRPASRAIPTN